MEEDRPIEKRSVRAFWKLGAGYEPTFQIIGHDYMLTDHDVTNGVAPPVDIKSEHEHLSFYRLRELYPCPPESKIPKAKRVAD
jgi:hypothetical protein